MLINNVEYVNKFPVFMIRMKNELRKVSNDVTQLPLDMFSDLSRITAMISEKGLVNTLFLNDIQSNWLAGLVSSIKTASESQVENCIESVKQASKVLLGLPNVMEA